MSHLAFMEMAVDKDDIAKFEADFERMALEDDDSEAKKILASGNSIHIAREDTPPGYVIRLFPDGHEELVYVDRLAAAAILGA